MATRQTASTRAKDSDRADSCQVLDSAFSEGQLSMEEHRQRVASATNAATLGELADLVADLQNANAPVQMPDLKKPAMRSPSKLWAHPPGAAGASGSQPPRCWCSSGWESAGACTTTLPRR